MSAKRSFVWQHFDRVTGNDAQCSVCEKVLCSAATSGMIKHLKIHDILDPAPEGTAKKRPERAVCSVKRSWVWKHFKKTSSSSAKCGICGKSIETKNFSTSGMRKHLKVHQLAESSDKSQEIEVQEDSEDQSDESEEQVNSSKDAPRSWVWGFFKRIGSSTTKCGICNRVISCKNSSTTGMINHLKIHKLTPESHGERIFQSDEEDEIFDDGPRASGSIETTKSWVWKYFTKISPESADCDVCGKQITCKNSGTTGMINHLKLHDLKEDSQKEGDPSAQLQSKKVEVLEIVQIEKPNDWVWKYFEEILDTSAQCKVCGQDVACNNSSTSALMVHLKAHGLTSGSRGDEPKSNRPRTYNHADGNKSWVWEYFTRLEADSAQCGICDKMIACKNSGTSGMINHLKLHNVKQDPQPEAGSSTKSSDESESEEDFEEIDFDDNPTPQTITKASDEDDKCFICNTFLGSLRNQLTKLLGFTGTPLYEVLESFTGTELSDEAMVCLAICQECFITIEQYDEFQLKSQEIQTKISDIYQQTHGEQIFIKQEPLDPPVSVEFKCQKCRRTFGSLKEMTRHNHTSGHALNSNTVSESFELKTRNQGVKYDLDVFQRTFFSRNELQASQPGRPVVPAQKAHEKEGDDVNPEFKKLAEAQGIDYNMDTFQKAFGFSEQEAASSRKPANERQQLQVTRSVTNKRKINEDFAETLKAQGIEYSLDTFQKAFGLTDSAEMEVKEKMKRERSNDVETLRKKGFLRCDDCNFKSTNRVAFYKHLRLHVPVNKNLQCETCEKIFKNETLLEVHKVIDHSGTNGPFECPVCFKSSPDKNSFRSHYNIHKLERNLLCMRCGATFAHKRSFTMHSNYFQAPCFHFTHTFAVPVMIHDDIRPFPCKFPGCTKTFRTPVKQKA